MRYIEETTGVAVGDHNINNLRHADFIVLIATSQKELQQMVDIVVVESEKTVPQVQ